MVQYMGDVALPRGVLARVLLIRHDHRKIRGRLVARSLDNDGFFQNNLTGDDDGGREELAVRGILTLLK